MTLYDNVYPLYLTAQLQSKISEDYSVLDDMEGFIALGTCNYNLLGRVFEGMLVFNNAMNREIGGLKLQSKGYDMSQVAVSAPIKLKNPMPVFADYRKQTLFGKNIHDKVKIYNDKIVLTKEQLAKICESVIEAIKAKKILLSDYYNLKELALPNVSIIVGLKTHNFATNPHENTITHELFLGANKVFKVKLCPKIKEETTIVEEAVKILYQAPIILHDTIKHSDYVDMFLAINYFVKNLPATYHKETIKSEETIITGKGNNKRYKQIVHLKREYHFDELNKMSKTHIKHIFTCLCWGVRGHFRHLKSGKVIFIQPFKKGKERNNMEAFSGKEYRL